MKIHGLLLDPPEYLQTAKVFDLLLAVPKYGRVKVNRILTHCRISPSKTIGGLSERQRNELVCVPAAIDATASTAPVLVITGPSGRRQGHADPAAARALPGPRSSRSPPPPAQPREGEVNGRDYHFLCHEEFDRAGGRRRLRRARRVRRQPLRHAALRARAPRRRDRARDRRPGRPAGARDPARGHQVFIAPPSLDVLRQRLEGPRLGLRRADRPPAGGRPESSWPPSRSSARWWSTTTWTRRWRSSWPSPLPCQAPTNRNPLIKPRLDTLLEQVDSHYACVLVAAKRARQINSYYHNLGEGTFDEYPPPMVETARRTTSRSPWTKSLRARSSTGTAIAGSGRGPHPARSLRGHRRLQGG